MACRLADSNAYADLLKQDSLQGSEERERFTARFTTGETYFFRDLGQLDLLVRHLLPELIRRHAADRRLRLWSAGCASGEEPYSLAILLREKFPQLAGWKLEIFASDINSQALEQARCGTYSDWSFRVVDESRKHMHFRRNGGKWQIAPEIQAMVQFLRTGLYADAIPDPAMGLANFDLIICRNVFIYMDSKAVAGIATKFAAALNDGGYLVTGHSELLGCYVHGLQTRVFPESVVMHKQRAKPPAMAVESRPAAEKPVRPVPAPPRIGSLPPLPAPTPKPPPPGVEEQLDGLLQQARGLADRGRAVEAGQVCEQALALAPLAPWPYFLLAQLALERGDAPQAQTLLKKVVYLEPALVAGWLELGALYEREGRATDAQRMRQTARRELIRLPGDTPVRPFENTTAADLLTYLEQESGGAAGQAPATARLSA